MKYSVSIRQSAANKRVADEIMLDYKDIEGLYNIIDDFYDKEYVIRIPKNTLQIDWDELKMFSEKVKLTLAIENIFMASDCNSRSINYYWAYPITTWYELNGLVDLGVKQLFLGVPLTFQLPEVKKIGLPIRVIANVCYDGFIPRKDGIRGFYIRPEDVKAYSAYVDTIQFDTDSLEKEATLLEIYKEELWPGNLNLLLTNLKYNVDNRGIPDEFAPMRIKCKQRCQSGSACSFCETALKFSREVDKNKDYWTKGVGFTQLESIIDNN